MKAYYDKDGKQVGTSKSMQGGCGQFMALIICLFCVILIIAAIVGAFH